jgi:hypothetical protein
MSEVLLDRAGRRRSPATMPGFHAGRSPRNKGLRYPADPPKVEEIVAVMCAAGDGPHGQRLRGLVVILWRAGLRIPPTPLSEKDQRLAERWSSRKATRSRREAGRSVPGERSSDQREVHNGAGTQRDRTWLTERLTRLAGSRSGTTAEAAPTRAAVRARRTRRLGGARRSKLDVTSAPGAGQRCTSRCRSTP